ncbi:MAG: citrate/2-methylcitrate synthase, partial [Chlorobiaceae bacterium]
MAVTKHGDSLTVTDNRTGLSFDLPIEQGAIRTIDLRQIKISPDDFGLLGYDPGYLNTASCKSKITYIDGDKGILRYRGYPIDQLAEKSTFLETAYLLIKGELPDKERLAVWTYNIRHNTLTHANMTKFMDGFRYDAHPMGILVGTIGALSTFYADAKNIDDEESRKLQVRRLIGKIPTLAAMSYRHSMGFPYVLPDDELSYTGNFLSMMFKMTEMHYKPNPVL